MKVNVHKVKQDGPNDISEIELLINKNILDPNDIVSIMGKTEGNGCVNDFTRGFATQALKEYFSKYISTEKQKEIVYVMSGGTEGVLTPHLTIFTKNRTDDSDVSPTGGLAVGIGRTRDFSPSEIGTLTMVKEVSNTVSEILTNDVKTEDSYKSMAYSRGASALGVAVALNEIKLSNINEKDICSNYDLYSSIASTSAGIEVQSCEIIVFGNSKNSTSQFHIQHDVMQNSIDSEAIHRATKKYNKPLDSIYTVFAKAEADPSGKILNNRHTMIDDSDISHTRMARAVVGAALSSVTKDTMIYVSGGSEHQGPSGGGPLSVIATLKK
jgi:cyanuric acid amidohydrolase